MLRVVAHGLSLPGKAAIMCGQGDIQDASDRIEPSVFDRMILAAWGLATVSSIACLIFWCTH